MSNKHGAVGAKDQEGRITAHAAADPSGAGYGTLCGLSLMDDEFQQVEIAESRRIDCEHCKSYWKAARLFKATDFA